jgi:hypothetical protein
MLQPPTRPLAQLGHMQRSAQAFIIFGAFDASGLTDLPMAKGRPFSSKTFG